MSMSPWLFGVLFWVQYVVPFVAAILGWRFWWRERVPLDRRFWLTLLALTIATASCLQHLGLVVYEGVMGGRLNHFSTEFTIWVNVNAVLLLAGIVSAVFGRGKGTLAAAIASALLMPFWAFTQFV